MVDTKISALTDGVTADLTDRIPVARAGGNRYITPDYIKTMIASLFAPLASPTFTGTVTFGAGAALNLDSGTATATAGAATLNKMAGKITSEALTTAAGGDYILTLTNDQVAAADMVFASVANGTNTGGEIFVELVQVSAGSIVMEIHNHSTLTALNGTIVISFLILKA
jgi:hypothetical protein